MVALHTPGLMKAECPSEPCKSLADSAWTPVLVTQHTYFFCLCWTTVSILVHQLSQQWWLLYQQLSFRDQLCWSNRITSAVHVSTWHHIILTASQSINQHCLSESCLTSERAAQNAHIKPRFSKVNSIWELCTSKSIYIRRKAMCFLNLLQAMVLLIAQLPNLYNQELIADPLHAVSGRSWFA